MYKISRIVFTFLIVTFALTVSAQDESRVSKTWDVDKYDITATVPQSDADRYLNVKSVLNLKNVGGTPASRLTLRISPNAEITSVKINDGTTEYTKGQEKVGTGNLQRVILRTPLVQPSGNLTVAVDYKLKVDENSGLAALSPVGSQFLPLSFWYPTPNSWYFARGVDFAPVRLQVNARNNQTSVSAGVQNGNVLENRLNGQPYFITGDWDSMNASNVTVLLPKGASADERKRAEELAALTNEAKAYTANLLGIPLDVPLRIVAVRRGAGFSGSGTIFVDEKVFRRQKIDSQTTMLIAEAVAKMWIGNAATVNGAAFGVIREGLPRFIATEFLESKYGRDIADIERLRQRTAYAAIVRRDAPLNVVSPLDDYYFPLVANKGAMIWRILAKNPGKEQFFNTLRTIMKDGNLELSELRSEFAAQKAFLDYAFEQITDMNLLVGLPQASAGETKVALRNTGSIDAVVNVTATTANGENLTAQATIPAKGFGEARFKTNNKIVIVEVDKDKLYPQTDYSDDVAPRQFDESDALLVIKRAFDKQDYAAAEKNVRIVLQSNPRFDEARIFLARSLLGQNKNAEAEKEFQAVLNENLPTARSIAWANVGLGEINQKNNQTANAVRYYNEAVKIDSEYGATLAARQGRIKANSAATVDDEIKNFFVQFDKAVSSNSKTGVESLLAPGEVAKFAAGIAGQTEQWQTKIVHVDKLDGNNVLVETNLSVKLLNRQPEGGTAVFRLVKVGNSYKLSGVEMFEVR
jgi:tetratricopeptide (TPR) repeat protein